MLPRALHWCQLVQLTGMSSTYLVTATGGVITWNPSKEHETLVVFGPANARPTAPALTVAPLWNSVNGWPVTKGVCDATRPIFSSQRSAAAFYKSLAPVMPVEIV